MEFITELFICIVIIIILGIVMSLYLDGYWHITSREIVKSNTYDISYRTNNGIVPNGKETKEVHKITYCNKRIRYVTKTLYH